MKMTRFMVLTVQEEYRFKVYERKVGGMGRGQRPHCESMIHHHVSCCTQTQEVISSSNPIHLGEWDFVCGAHSNEKWHFEN